MYFLTNTGINTATHASQQQHVSQAEEVEVVRTRHLIQLLADGVWITDTAKMPKNVVSQKRRDTNPQCGERMLTMLCGGRGNHAQDDEVGEHVVFVFGEFVLPLVDAFLPRRECDEDEPRNLLMW